MNYYYVMRSLLFEGLTQEDVEAFLKDTGARIVSYGQGDHIYRIGEHISEIGFVLSGSVRYEYVDMWGEVSIVGVALPGKTFGEAQACAGDYSTVMDFIAHEDCEVLFMDAEALIRPDPRISQHIYFVSGNLARLVSLRNIELSKRGFVMGAKTTREKVLLYLSLFANEVGKRTFDIPYNREQLAQYLGVERTALSATLSRMRDAGEIDFRKNHFTIFENVS